MANLVENQKAKNLTNYALYALEFLEQSDKNKIRAFHVLSEIAWFVK